MRVNEQCDAGPIWKGGIIVSSQGRPLLHADSGQMLLASGLVLMLSLLSMAWYGVSVAGLGEPYDAGSREVLEASRDVMGTWQPLVENRSNSLVSAGNDWDSSVQAAAESATDDLMRHGEHRGVEIVLTDITVSNNSGVFSISAEVGIADRHARMQITALTAVVDLT